VSDNGDELYNVARNSACYKYMWLMFCLFFKICMRLRRARVASKSANYLRHVRLPACPFLRIWALVPLDGFRWNLILGTLCRYIEEVQIVLNSGKNRSTYTRRRKYALLLPAALNRRKSALFEWNGTYQAIGYPKRYKHYANAPHCYVIRSLPVLCIFRFFIKPASVVY
jgi:hypothetical protein